MQHADHGEPIIFDGNMDNMLGDPDFKCFDPSVLTAPHPPASPSDADNFFLPAAGTSPTTPTSALSTALLSRKRPASPAAPKDRSISPADTRSASPENSSHGSSVDSPPEHGHVRNYSLASNSSMALSNGTQITAKFEPEKWTATAGGFSAAQNGFFHPEFTMDSAFDFESAASSPSPLNIDALSHSHQRLRPVPQNPHQSASTGHLGTVPNAPQFVSASPFYFNAPTDSASTGPFLNQSLTSRKWEGQSPATDIGESLGSVSMGSTSPLSSTLSPSLGSGFHFNDPSAHPMLMPPPIRMSQATPDTSTPPVLIIHPTSQKSRVETQIPIKLTLYPFPAGVKKLRLPAHAISKPKFLAKSPLSRTPEILELHTNVVCTSAMQDRNNLERAFVRARETRSGDGSNEALTPLNGGDVKICNGCIQRERKRASRKKQRKPEEDELFQKDEGKRVVVFNTSELKDWTESSKHANSDASTSMLARSMQVELPMRIACYCRHQSEKIGFQVIFTIKDHLDNVVAQSITNSIMITDDHKTHAPSASVPPPPPIFREGPTVPGAGIFSSLGATSNNQSYRAKSTTDLSSLQDYQFPPAQRIPQSFAQPIIAQSRGSSRHPSPAEFQAPSSKRRKQSGSSKLPGLTVPKMESSRASSAAASSSRRQPSFQAPHVDRGYATPLPFGNAPPTPNSGEGMFLPQIGPRNAEAIHAQLMSAPNSVQTSRPASPGDMTPFQSQIIGVTPPTISSQAWPLPPPNPPNHVPPMIHKLVPTEGSTTGGSEVTILGNGFYPGMEIVFGDTLATTTTFWGDKCLNCLTPPAVHPGVVQVVFKHEHPSFGNPQVLTQALVPKPAILYRYVDDRELQMYRVALGILGQKLRNPTDAFQTAQQIMGSDPNHLWSLQTGYNGNGSSQQRHNGHVHSENGVSDLDAKMLDLLEFMDLDETPGSPQFNWEKSSTGQTLLHYAASLGLTRFTADLLARGANAEVQDNNGNTPLHLAALGGHTNIVRRLRVSGANAAAANLREFTPADLATDLDTHRAALVPPYRSHSVGSSSSRRRKLSTASLDEFWETSSDDVVSSDSTENSTQTTELEDKESSEYLCSESQTPSHSRQTNTTDISEQNARRDSSPVGLVTWRNQLTAQINHFQQNVNRAFPHLRALPPIPDYQANPMMRRITSLVPHRSSGSWSTTIVKDGWDRLTGASSSPPAYEELYPGKNEQQDDYGVKKASAVQAAADAVADQHFESLENDPSSSTAASTGAFVSSPPVRRKKFKILPGFRIGRRNTSREQQEQLRKARARKMKQIGSDRKLFLIWIPLFLILLYVTLRGFLPGLWDEVIHGYRFITTRYQPRILDAIAAP